MSWSSCHLQTNAILTNKGWKAVLALSEQIKSIYINISQGTLLDYFPYSIETWIDFTENNQWNVPKQCSVSLFVNANVYVTIWNKQSNNVAYFALYNNDLNLFQHLKYKFSSKCLVANKWNQNIVRQYFDKPTFCILTIWFLLLKLVVAIMKWDTRLVWNFHHIMFSYIYE